MTTPDKTLIKLLVDTSQVAVVLEAVRHTGVKHHVTLTDPEPEETAA